MSAQALLQPLPAAPQAVFTAILSPVHRPAGTEHALNSLPGDQKSVRVITNFARVSTALMATGVINIVFGCAIAASDVVSLSFNAKPSYALTGIWAGFVFGVINGALAIKAATMKPHITRHWANVNLGLGIAALIVHLAPVVATAVSLSIYSYRYIYYTSYNFHLFAATLNIMANDAARLVMCVVLLTADICQLVAVSISLKQLRESPDASAAAVVVIPGQTISPMPMPMQMQMPMAAPPQVYAMPSFPNASFAAVYSPQSMQTAFLQQQQQQQQLQPQPQPQQQEQMMADAQNHASGPPPYAIVSKDSQQVTNPIETVTILRSSNV